MTTSLITFENQIHEWLLDLLHSQWRLLGVPFSTSRSPRPHEVIDPEALLWCSLEFFPSEPRLREQVLAWLAGNDKCLLRPRIRKFARGQSDPRSNIWNVLDPQWKSNVIEPTQPCYGQKSVAQLLQFCRDLADKPNPAATLRQKPGLRQRTDATVLLRARDALGSDAKHFLLVYLLANPGGAKLRPIATWSGQSYRNIFNAASRWEVAHIVSIEHGYCRLKNPAPWEDILELESNQILLLDWARFYDTSIQLLQALNKAQAALIPADSPVIATILREAVVEIEANVLGNAPAPCQTALDLKNLLTNQL